MIYGKGSYYIGTLSLKYRRSGASAVDGYPSLFVSSSAERPKYSKYA